MESNKKVKVVKPKDDAQIQPASQIEFQNFSSNGWEFHHSVQGMSSEREMDQVSDKVGIMGLPEVFYGFNHLYISNKSLNILLDFNAIDSLALSGYDMRAAFLNPSTGVDLFKIQDKQQQEEVKQEAQEQEVTTEQIAAQLVNLSIERSGLSDAEKSLNVIDIIAPAVQVAQAGLWRQKDTSKIKDYRAVDQTSDWTYSTAYKGTVRYLTNAVKSIRDETSLELDCLQGAQIGHLSLVHTPEAAIPFDMLSPQNPILHFGEVYLFESDLEDCGYTMSKIRFRVMADCFYALVRYYLRVDGVKVRIFDARIFHQFGEDYIHREFQYRESSYDDLKRLGFDLSSEWLLSPNQSDLVFPKLQPLMLVQERIMLGSQGAQIVNGISQEAPKQDQPKEEAQDCQQEEDGVQNEDAGDAGSPGTGGGADAAEAGGADAVASGAGDGA